MAFVKPFRTLALLLALAPMPCLAQDYKAAARSLELLGIDLSRAQRKEITAQFGSAHAEDQDWHDRSVALLDDLAQLSLEAQRPSTRIRLTDMHRQLVERLLPEENLARDLLNEQDPELHPVEPGVGMTKRDMGWAIMLEALRQSMPEDPRDLNVPAGKADEILKVVTADFEAAQPGARHFLARVDSWGVGTVTTWKNLTPAERQMAASVVTGDEMPPPDLIEKVIGTPSMIYWAAGAQIGLTEAEVKRYPELIAYLGEGHLAGGLLPHVAGAMDASLATTTIMQGTFDMMWDLNMEILFGN